MCWSRNRIYDKLMKECLKNNNILMYSTHNEGKSVIAEEFVRTLNAKIYKKCYLAYWNELVDKYNNTYHHSSNKKPVNADYSALNEKIETNSKAPKFRVKWPIQNY